MKRRRKMENSRKRDKKIEIDISGQIQQLNHDSALGFSRDNGIEKSVYLRSKDKKEIIKKYGGQVTNLIEKLHCILVYYLIKDELKEVTEIKVCKDVDFRTLKNLLPLLFKEQNYLDGIKIIVRTGDEQKSKAHRFALRTFRRRKYASQIINKKILEEMLFKFKKNK